jgi:hypothetical protein
MDLVAAQPERARRQRADTSIGRKRIADLAPGQMVFDILPKCVGKTPPLDSLGRAIRRHRHPPELERGITMSTVRQQSLCPRPTVLHRKITQIWNEAAYGRQKAGADIGEGLGCYSNRHRVDDGKPGANRWHVERDRGRLISQQHRNPFHRRSQIAQVNGQKVAALGALERSQHVRQGCRDGAAGRRRDMSFGPFGHELSSFRERRDWPRAVSGGRGVTGADIREFFYHTDGGST